MSDLAKFIDDRMNELAKLVIIPADKKDQIILIQKLFVLVSEVYRCKPESIIMKREEVCLRDSSSARHFLIYFFHKKIGWNAYRTSKLFSVSADTIPTSIIKFRLKTQDVTRESNKIKEATEILLLNFNQNTN